MLEETEKITLPISQKICEIKAYVTGYIDQEVKKIIAGANKARYEVDAASLESQTPGELPANGKMIMEADPTANIKGDNKLLELMVVGLDDLKNDVLPRILQLPKQDVDHIMARVKALYEEGEVKAGDPKAPSN